ncbi:hypothetical protein [Agromyces sp. Marseille-Q5079]|uniref:hypothetical protein n=1 Tax=Agromyces sp. Marseille-Q5079 TaxID=3439059 RepID=UPI003D9C9FB3
MGFTVILVYVVGLAIVLTALYFVIRGAVLSALRAHVTSSTTGVSIVSANPLRVVVQGDDSVDAPSAAQGDDLER